MKKSSTLILIMTFALLVLSGCNEKKSEPASDDVLAVKDICNNEYKCVKIGNQVWMAENLRCDKYDTRSKRAGEKISTSENVSFSPYYTDATDKHNWGAKYATEELLQQVDKLGYSYNWAAAVGFESGEAAESQTTPFEGDCQGICPNGWHVPTNAEWDALAEAMGGIKHKNGNFLNIGKKLKTTSGWYNGGNGTDDCSFAVLPAGYAYGSTVKYVGSGVAFWTATPYVDDELAYDCYLGYDSDALCKDINYKNYALYIRCVMN